MVLGREICRVDFRWDFKIKTFLRLSQSKLRQPQPVCTLFRRISGPFLLVCVCVFCFTAAKRGRERYTSEAWEFAKGWGPNVSCDFGGGQRTIKCPLQNQFLEASEGGDLSGLWSFPLRRMRGREQGRGKRIISGGVQNRFWGGALWCVFPLP